MARWHTNEHTKVRLVTMWQTGEHDGEVAHDNEVGDDVADR